MNNKDIEKKLVSAYSKIETPDVFDSILSDVKYEERVIYMEEKMSYWKKGLAFACALILCIGGFTSYSSFINAVDSVIVFDVNPSVELEINKNERVIDVNGLNDDGNKIIQDMDLKGTDLDVAVNALIGSMVKQGYINDLSNSILVTIDSKDNNKAEKLQKQLSEEVDQYMKEYDLEGAVLTQKVQMNDDIKQLATDHKISNGKALLVSKLVEADSTHTFDELSKLSIHELNLISQSKQEYIDSVKVTGNASEKKYIGVDKAAKIALNDLKLNKKDIQGLEVEMDMVMDTMVYEVEFLSNDLEYDYTISAIDGNILYKATDKEDMIVSKPEDETMDVTSYISKEEAKEIVLNDAKLNDKEVHQYWIEMDNEDGVVIYEIEFKSGSVEYDYKLLADDGTILAREVDDKSNKDKSNTEDNKPNKPNQEENKPDKSTIDKNEAKDIALNHAGLSKKDVKKLKAEFDNEDGRNVYEVEFESNGLSYDYVIDASTGSILEFDKEIDD